MSSTLLISLDGIKNEQVQQIVQARGIDKVIVAGSSTGFNNGSAIAGITAASQLRSGDTAVELAVADTGDLALDAATIAAIESGGLTFLSDSGLASLTNAVVATQEFVDSPRSDAVLPIYIPDSETILGNDKGGLVIKSNIGEMPVLTPVVGTTELNDFGGTVRVNLSATDFAGLLRSGGFEKIDSPENITILDSAPEANSVGPYLAIDPDSIPEFDGLNQLGNINTFDSAHDTPGTNDSTFYWNTAELRIYSYQGT